MSALSEGGDASVELATAGLGPQAPPSESAFPMTCGQRIAKGYGFLIPCAKPRGHGGPCA